MQTTAIGVMATAARRSSAHAADQEPLPFIDCHAHIYSADEQKYPTIEKPYRPPAGTGTVGHLQKVMRESGVKYVTAIQTSTFYRWDNRFTADASRANKDFMAGICTLDPDNPASPKQLADYARSFNIRGMRSIPAKSGHLDDPGVAALWRTAEELGIVINVLVNADKRGEIEALVARHPKLNVVIDHCLNVKAGPDLETTLKTMTALAALPTLHAKLSFLPTGSAEEYPLQDMHEPCQRIIEAYGPQRCVWGSDFPCELWCPKVTYAQHLKIFTHELGLSAGAQRAILWETPKRLWFADKA
jgi:predicted TIM-barrel fold metal-dependent hydrolase